MENNLLQNVKSYFSDEVINKLSSYLGEDSDNIRKGVDVSIPSLLLGLQSHNGDGLASILNSAKHLFSNFNFNDITGGFFGGADSAENTQFQSSNIVNGIFGDKLSGIIGSLSSFLGIKSSSVNGIFEAVIPSIVSGITNKGSNWDLSSITNLLNSNKSSFASALPAGLGLGAFGSMFASADTPKEIEGGAENLASEHVHEIPKVVEPVRPDPKIVHTQHAPMAEEEKKGAGFWWLLIPILLIGLWLLFGKGCQGDKKDAVAQDTLALNTDTSLHVNATPEDVVVTREYIDVQLPNGSALKAYPQGIEENLITFLKSDYKSLSEDQLKEKWFDFDNLNFETGTAKVLPESQQQLDNIAAILTLFPEAKIKIGGYTDKTGDEAINKKLSKERAEAVKAFLTGKGLGGQVVDAEGYGSEFATVPVDASDAERAKDRRVAVSVRN